jgi:hypothetical protein
MHVVEIGILSVAGIYLIQVRGVGATTSETDQGNRFVVTVSLQSLDV